MISQVTLFNCSIVETGSSILYVTTSLSVKKKKNHRTSSPNESKFHRTAHVKKSTDSAVVKLRVAFRLTSIHHNRDEMRGLQQYWFYSILRFFFFFFFFFAFHVRSRSLWRPDGATASKPIISSEMTQACLFSEVVQRAK